MKRYHLFFLIVALLLPAMAFSQDDDDEYLNFDAYIAELNSQCPIVYNTEWSVLSFAASGDTAFAKIEVPSTITYFLSALTGDKENVKELWKKQLLQFGKVWRDFIRRLKYDKRTLVIELIPQESDTSAIMTFSPEDLKNK